MTLTTWWITNLLLAALGGAWMARGACARRKLRPARVPVPPARRRGA